MIGDGLAFERCVFQENIALVDKGPEVPAGAVSITADPDGTGEITFDSCGFGLNGVIDIVRGAYSGAGGAVRVDGQAARMTYCNLESNFAAEGGSLYGQFELVNCELTGDVSYGYGGAAYLLEGSSLFNCEVGGTSECNYPWLATNGAISIDGCTFTFGYPEGSAVACAPDPAELAGCLLAKGSTVRDTRFCNFAPAAIFGDWNDLGGNLFTPDECVFEDINLDGRVDGTDLAILLSAWGEICVPCRVDLNGDALVDGSDLARVLAAWSG